MGGREKYCLATVLNVYSSRRFFPSHEPSDLVAKELQRQVSYLIPASFDDSPIVISLVLYHSGVAYYLGVCCGCLASFFSTML